LGSDYEEYIERSVLLDNEKEYEGHDSNYAVFELEDAG